MSSPWLSVWPVLPPKAAFRREIDGKRLAYPLGARGCVLYSRARHGLWHGVRHLGLGPGDEILTPDYHHGSEVEALVRTGARPRFYPCDEALAPGEAALDALLRPGVRALYLTHYLGFPQDVRRWRDWCDGRGLLLIEDAAQAWLATAAGQPVGSAGDLAIFCLYKTFGLPDGAALTVPSGPPDPPAGGARGVVTAVGLGIDWLRGRFALLSTFLPPAAQDGYMPEQDFALGDPDTAPAASTAFLLPRVFDPEAAARRRANYEVLLAALAERVPSPFDELPEGASPFVFPVTAEPKSELLERLARHGVEGLDLWSVPHPALPAGDFPRSRERRSRTVGLPVHQELRPADLDRIAAAAAPGAAGRPELSLDPLDGFNAARPEWAALADEAGDIFATWEWASTWWRHFGDGGARLLLTAARDRAGRLVAVLPLY
nr:DegT/DnrJ/EryC1/StrS family aminotransferase [Actinomycetota bacterium]